MEDVTGVETVIVNVMSEKILEVEVQIEIEVEIPAGHRNDPKIVISHRINAVLSAQAHQKVIICCI